MIVRDQHADWRVAAISQARPRGILPGYAADVNPEGDEARTRIQRLLVTGDNRLKQGVAAEKVRESYEQALELAREAGIEERVRPLVELRLADLARLARESPRSAPPDA
jgi:hypothetical protein